VEENKMEKWKSIEPGVWKPKQDGDQIIGVLINKEPKEDKAVMSARYYLENEKGTWLVWGSTVLDDRMQYAKPGQKVRITYEGKTKNKRNQDVNLYKVDVAESEPSDADTTPGADNNKNAQEDTIEVEHIE